MNKYSSKSAQGGFTLIELIVVIVILGILAATALPKFASLGGDARIASMQAAKGALSATASMVHGKYLLKPGVAEITVEGTKVAITNGYPTGGASLAEAAGITSDDYTIDTATTGSLIITPKSIVDNATLRGTCYVKYTSAVADNAPTFDVKLTKCD